MFTGKHIEFLNFNDKLYRVYRRIPKNRITDGHVLDVRDLWHCDMVLKTKTQEEEMFLFLMEISDAEIINDILPNPTPASIPESQDLN